MFSTVHTNDAAGGITRLTDMNIEPFLIASSVSGLMAQRLVRRPCYEVRCQVRPSEALLRELGLERAQVYAGVLAAAGQGQRNLPVRSSWSPPGCPKRAAASATAVAAPESTRCWWSTTPRASWRMQKADAGAIRDAAIAAPAWSACAPRARARSPAGAHHCRGGPPRHRGRQLMAMYAYKGISPSGKAVSGGQHADLRSKLVRALLRKDGGRRHLGRAVQAGRASKAGAKAGSGLSKEVDLGAIWRRPRSPTSPTSPGSWRPCQERHRWPSRSTSLFEQTRTTSRAQGAVGSEVRTAVNEGSLFADALAKHPKIFDELYVSMVRAGEVAGNLDEVLDRSVDFDSAQKLKGKVQSARSTRSSC